MGVIAVQRCKLCCTTLALGQQPNLFLFSEFIFEASRGQKIFQHNYPKSNQIACSVIIFKKVFGG